MLLKGRHIIPAGHRRSLHVNKTRLFLETPLFLLYALAYHSGHLNIVDAFIGLVEDKELCSTLKSYCILGQRLREAARRNIDPAAALTMLAREASEPVSSLLASYAQVLRISGNLLEFLETWSQTFMHRVDKFLEERGELINTLLEVVVLSSTMLMLSILFLNLGNVAMVFLASMLMAVFVLSIGVYLRTPTLSVYLGLPDNVMKAAAAVSWGMSLAGYTLYSLQGARLAAALLIAPALAASIYIMYRVRREVRVLDEISSFLELVADEVRSGVRLDTQVLLERIKNNPRLLALSYVLQTGLEPSFSTRDDPLTRIVKKFLAVLVRSGAEASRTITIAADLLSRIRTFTDNLHTRGLFYEAVLVMAVVVMVASIKTYCAYMTKPIIPGLNNTPTYSYMMPGLEGIIYTPSKTVLKAAYLSIVAVLDSAAAAIAAVTRSNHLLASAPPLIALGAIAATMISLA